MAIAFDTSANYSFQVGSGNLSGSFTCTGSDRLLVVVTFGSINTDDVTNVTYNGVSCTKLGSALVPGGLDRYCDYWYLLGPASGANTLTAVYSGSNAVGMSAASYTGVQQSGQPDSSNSGTTGSSTTLTIATSVVSAGCWLVMCSKQDATLVTTAGSGGTIAATIREGTANALAIADSNGATVPTGSQSLQVQAASSSNWAGLIASFSPVSGAAAGYLLVKN